MMHGWPRLAACATGVALSVVFAACVEEGRPCYPGDYRTCDCGAGVRGYSRCDADGQVYGACDCSGTIPGLAASSSAGAGGGTGGSGGAGGAEKLPFMAECTTNEECETGLCYDFNAKGPHCTQSC